MKKIVAAFLSLMLAVCLSMSAVTLFASAASGSELAVADDPDYTTTVDLKGENVLDDFAAVFAASGGSITAGEVTDVWDYDAENGTFTSKEALSKTDEVWSNFYYLYYTGTDYKNFYMEVTLTHVTTRGGWSGLAYGVQDVSKPAKGATENPFGGLSFVQGDGKYTWHNPKINGSEWNDTGIVATDFNGLNDTVHKLKVYDGHMQYWLNDEANVVVDVAVPDGGLTAGKVGIAVSNKAVAVKSIKITRLNSEGQPGSDGAEEIPVAQSLQVTGLTDGQSAVVGTPVGVSTAILPEGASQAVSFSSDRAGASFVNGKLLFKEAGTYKLTFSAVENAEIKQEFTVNVSPMEVEDGYIRYTLTEAGMARFQTMFIAGGSGNGGVAANWSDHFTLENGALTRSGTSTGNVGNNTAALYFGSLTLKNFELIYSAKGNSSNGWFGAFFAMKDITQSGNQNGVMAFMQNASAAKNATLWGGSTNDVGGPGGLEAGSTYLQNEWSIFKLRVVNGLIQFYVNDMETPLVTKQASSDLTGRIALFADDGCAGSFKDVYLGELDENGDLIPYKAVESVTIAEKPATAYAGDTFTLQASAAPSDAEDTTLIYFTSDDTIATVTEEGVVSFLKGGEVTIFASSADDPAIFDSFKVNVLVHVESVEITNAPVTALEGTQLTLEVSVLPADASDKAVSFASDDPEIAAVDADGVVSFLKPGKATITVTTADGSKTDSFEVEVTAKPVPVESVSISNKPAAVRAGDELALKVNVSPAEATNKSVTYASSNDEIATVSPSGVVSFLAEGEVTITVTSVSDDTKKDSFTIQVGPAPVLVASVAISNKPATATEGDEITLQVTVSPENAENKALIFHSSDESVALVGTDGKVSFLRPGSVTITVTSESNAAAKDSFTVSVAMDLAGYIHYDLTDEGMSFFETVFIAGGSGNGGASGDWSDYYTLENGVITRSGTSTGKVGENISVLYFRNRNLKNFELVYTAKGNGLNGWFGAFFAMTDTTQSGSQNGVMAFMQNDSAAKNATLWGGAVSGIGGPHENGTTYQKNEWSTFKIRVVNGVIEFYVNDMNTPAVTRTSSNDLTGRIGLFADDGCAGAFKDVYLAILDDEGDLVPYKAVESVAIGNKQAGAEVGDKFSLNVSVLPADAYDPNVTYSSSNPVVAAVSADGSVTCILAGETTITVTSKEDPSKSDSFTLTVTEPAVPVTSVTISNKAETAEIGDSLTLQISVAPSNADDKSVTFESSDTSVATVSGEGVVSFLKEGTVTITVTSAADPTKSDSFTVTVSDEDSTTDPGTDPGGNDEDPGDETPGGGCSSAVFGGMTVLALVATGAAVAILRKKKE